MLDVRRRCAQTARISLLFHQCQRAIFQTKNVRPANSLAYPDAPCLQIFRTSTLASAAASVRHRRRSASVRRYLRMVHPTRKRKKCEVGDFFQFGRKIVGNPCFADRINPDERLSGKIVSHCPRIGGPEDRLSASAIPGKGPAGPQERSVPAWRGRIPDLSRAVTARRQACGRIQVHPRSNRFTRV